MRIGWQGFRQPETLRINTFNLILLSGSYLQSAQVPKTTRSTTCLGYLDAREKVFEEEIGDSIVVQIEREDVARTDGFVRGSKYDFRRRWFNQRQHTNSGCAGRCRVSQERSVQSWFQRAGDSFLGLNDAGDLWA